MRLPRTQTETILSLSLLAIFTFLLLVRPPIPFYVLPLAPIALAALLYQFTGGLIISLLSLAGAVFLIITDPSSTDSKRLLYDAGPILTMYLVVGIAVGWLAQREHKIEEARNNHMLAISHACREIAALLNLSQALQLIMDKAAETLPMDAGAIFQWDAKAQTYRIAVSRNILPERAAQISFAFEQGAPGWVAKHRQTLVVPNAKTDARIHPYIIEEGVKSVMAIPLIAREKVLGILNLFSKTKEDAFSKEAVSLAEVFAAQAAVALENARLVDALREAAVELEARVEERTQQLHESQTQIIRAEKLAMVGRLAGSIAHEVNNPLQAIALQLQLIGETGLNDSAAQRLTIVQEELSRIAELVQRLLDFQRPTLGQQKAHQASDLIDDVLALAGKQLQQRQIEVIRYNEPNIDPVWVAGNRIKQVLLNLILNAIEAMPEGGQLNINLRQENETVIFTFTDSGHGMSQTVIDHLFEPFFSTKENGAGLGLAVSHEIISQHNGFLQVSSVEGQGATFILGLPRAKKEILAS